MDPAPPRGQLDTQRPSGSNYGVDPIASAAALLAASPPRYGHRRQHCTASVAGQVTLDQSGDLVAVDLVLSPQPGRGLWRPGRRRHGWQRTPTLVTTIRVYRVDSSQYRAEIRLGCDQAAGHAVLSLTRWPCGKDDPPAAPRFRAATLTDVSVRSQRDQKGPSDNLPQLYLRLVLVPPC